MAYIDRVVQISGCNVKTLSDHEVTDHIQLIISDLAPVHVLIVSDIRLVVLRLLLLQTVLNDPGDAELSLGAADSGGDQGGEPHVELGGGLAAGLPEPSCHRGGGPGGERESAADLVLQVRDVLEMLIKEEIIGGGHRLPGGGGGLDWVLGTPHWRYGGGPESGGGAS